MNLGEVEGALVAEEREISQDVLLDFFGFGFAIDLLEFRDDFGDAVIAVAALNDLKTGAIQSKSAFGHKEDALIFAFAQANAGGETWP